MRTNQLKPLIKKAYITISGFSFMTFTLTGEKLPKSLLAPYISNPDDIVYFDRYDVTNLLNDGESRSELSSATVCKMHPAARFGILILLVFVMPCVALGITYIDNDGNETILTLAKH